jgi:hypothetical protein
MNEPVRLEQLTPQEASGSVEREARPGEAEDAAEGADAEAEENLRKEGGGERCEPSLWGLVHQWRDPDFHRREDCRAGHREPRDPVFNPRVPGRCYHISGPVISGLAGTHLRECLNLDTPNDCPQAGDEMTRTDDN